VIGILISTAAMVIVLSAFNGVEGLVLSLFNSFESDIKIEATHAKTFPINYINQEVFNDKDIINYTPVIEETVIIKNDDEYTFGTLKGVNNSFLEMVNMEEYLLDGKPILSDLEGDFALIGVGALQNLGGYIFQVPGQYDNVTIFSPNRNEKIKRNSTSAFKINTIDLVGTFSFNNTIDASFIIVPLEYAATVLNYTNEISAIEIDYPNDIDLALKKIEIQQLVGPTYKVETAYEQNELIFKTSKSEKWLTVILLGFIFFLGTFNMVASLAMLVIEKRDNLKTMRAMGAEENQLQNVFFYVGLLINGLGMLTGLGIGYLVCFLQTKFGFIKMEGGMVEYFPIDIHLTDFIMILSITSVIGMLAAWIPSKVLIKKMI